MPPTKIHFIGIGGIGISGLARYLRAQGVEVSGSDICENAITQSLQALGIPITIPHHAGAITNQDVVIHSAIIKQNNIEIVAAKERGIAVLSRKEALPMILSHKKVYAIAGAHGKSTTSAILSTLLPEASAIIGAISKEFGSNVREIKSESVVFEADESDQSFLHTNPYCSIVVNAEPEHLENYHNDAYLLRSAYAQFLLNAPKRVINAEDPYLRTLEELRAVRLFPCKDITDVSYELVDGEPYTRFCLRDLGSFCVWGIGEHIALDAALALLALVGEVDLETLRRRLADYRGIKKRFDVIQKGKLIIIDDYAHHPTEIETTLVAVNRYCELLGGRDLCVIWQPHKYSRLAANLERFKSCFGESMDLVILPVYAVGEMPLEIDLAEEFAHYRPTMASHIMRINHGDDQRILVMQGETIVREIDSGMVVGFGAGDITNMLRG